MNRRSILRILGLAPVAAVVPAAAAPGNLICAVVGHRWEFTHNSAIEEGEGDVN
jgi:hypothetical protein